MKLNSNSYLKAKEAAKELRNNPTPAEKELWKILRKRNIMGYKFLRQHPIFFHSDGFNRFLIIDFYCSELKLAIEVDGLIHREQKEYDDIRDKVLQEIGIRTIRIRNEEIMYNNKIKNMIIEKVKSYKCLLHNQPGKFSFPDF